MWALRRTSRTYAITGVQSWTFLGRRVVAFAGIAVSLLLLLAAGSCAAPQPPPQRIILVTIDTLRADHLGMYGYPRGVSPFLDDLADRSVVFEQAFSSCSHTAPSHASLFTSLQPAQHRLLVNGEVLDDQLLTIAELLSQQGYRTAAFTPVRFLNGLSAGFDLFGSSEKYEPAEAVLTRAFEWLEKTSVETKSFVWIHLYDVHEWRVPKRLHRTSVRWVRENATLQRGELQAWLRANHGVPRDLGDLGPSILRSINRYDGQLYAVDEALENFFGKVRALGFADEAIWLFTSDHGEGLGNHHQMGHGRYIYDEEIRVPLLVHSPDGRFKPARVGPMVRLVDVAPMIADLVGADMMEQPIPVVGQSLVPLLRDPRAKWTVNEAFSQRRPADQRRIDTGWVPGDVFATRSRTRKLIINPGGPCELYDLLADPFEIDNICRSTDPEIAALISIQSDRFEFMKSQSEAVRSGSASPDVIEELKALGYL